MAVGIGGTILGDDGPASEATERAKGGHYFGRYHLKYDCGILSRRKTGAKRRPNGTARSSQFRSN